MDTVVIGTAANVEAEYGACTGNPAHKFILAHFYNGEPVAVEGFETKDGVIAAVQEYHGAEVERLFVELEA